MVAHSHFMLLPPPVCYKIGQGQETVWSPAPHQSIHGNHICAKMGIIPMTAADYKERFYGLKAQNHSNNCLKVTIRESPNNQLVNKK